MSDTALMTAATGASTAATASATFLLLGVQIPTFSFLMAVTMSVLVRLWVSRKSTNTLSILDNIVLSTITSILSLGFVIEYQLSVFWAVMVTGGVSFAGETILVTLSDETITIIKNIMRGWGETLTPGKKKEVEDEPADPVEESPDTTQGNP